MYIFKIFLKYIHIIIILFVLLNKYNYVANLYSYKTKNFCIANEIMYSISNKIIFWDDLYFKNIFILSNPLKILINLNIENNIKINSNIKIIYDFNISEKLLWNKYKKIYSTSSSINHINKIINIILLNKYQFANKVNKRLEKYNIYIYHKIKIKNINIKLNKVRISLLNKEKRKKYYKFYYENIKLNIKTKNFIINYYKKNIKIGPVQFKDGIKYIWIYKNYFKYNLFNDKRIFYKNIIDYINIENFIIPIYIINISSIYSYYCYI